MLRVVVTAARDEQATVPARRRRAVPGAQSGGTTRAAKPVLGEHRDDFLVVLRLEEIKKGEIVNVHFVFVVGWVDSGVDADVKRTKWLVKDPSGADVNGEDVPNTVSAPLGMTKKYDKGKYTIASVVELTCAQRDTCAL